MAAGAARNRIFISCVTKEFSDLRSALRSYLSRADCDVKVQEDFCQTPEDTIEKLDAYIRTCAAVIHLVGQASGASAHPVAVRTYLAGFDAAQPFLGRSPELRAALGDFSGLSYTQWEAFIAMHHGIRPFVYQTDGPYGGYAATDAEKTNQSQHVERLRLGRRYPEVFAGEQDLFGKLIGDLRKILPATAGHQPFNLPGSIGTLFKGREDFLGKLHDTLEAATADTGTNGAHAAPRGVAAISTPRAIHGLGGVGKTRTAIEYGHRFRGEYSALLLVRADTPESLRLNLAELTGPLVLDLPAATAPDQEAQLAAAIHWLEEHPRWFLILDNVDNEDSAREVESLLGRLRGGHIVITTRLGNWSGQVEALDLDVLGEEAAVEFLLARTAGRRPTTPTDAADVRTLARELDNLALALEQAGAYIHERRMSFAAYLRRWQESRSAVLIWFNERAMQYPASVAVTWATTFEQLGASARALLEMLAFLSSAPIPRALLETDESPVILAVAELGPEARELPSGEAPSAFAMEDALAELANYSLVRYLDEPPVSFSMHRLVQEIVRSRLEEAARTGRWGQTVRLASAYAPRGGYDISTWSRWAELAPHLETLFKKAREQGDPEPIPNLLNGFAGFLQYCSAAYSTAEPLYRRALKALERVLGAEHQDTLTSVHNLAGLLHAKGDYAGAESLSRRALQMREKVLGAEHPDTLGSVNALASLLQAKGDYASAEPLLRRALEVGERLLGAEHPFTLASINNLAGLLAARGDNAIAETLYRRVLEASERLMGAEHPDTLTCVNNLANVLQARWDCAAAETLYRRALETRERMLGPEHLRVQLYWTVCGSGESVASNYLQRQRGELAWIRNVISSVAFPYEENRLYFRQLSFGSQLAVLGRIRVQWLEEQTRFFEKSVTRLTAAKATCSEVSKNLLWTGFLLTIHLFGAPWLNPTSLPAGKGDWCVGAGGLLLGLAWLWRRRGERRSNAKGVEVLLPTREHRNQVTSYLLVAASCLCSIGVGLLLGQLRWWMPDANKVTGILKTVALASGALLGAWMSVNFFTENIHRYTSMISLFEGASQRLKEHLQSIEAAGEDEKGQAHQKSVIDIQRMLIAVGKEALVENAEWLMVHRTRPLEPLNT